MADRPLEGSVDSGGAALDGPDWLATRPERFAAPGSGVWAALAFAVAAGAIFAVHVPVFDHYVFGDDFSPLADIASRTTWQYVRDLFLLHDLTPNWRFLTGLFYLGAYRAFGLNAFPFFLASVLVHSATAGLIFWLVWRVLGQVWPSFLAAAFFGLGAAHVPTVGQVTAFNNVLGAFLVMLAIVTLYEGLARGRTWWFVASSASFAAAVASTESVALLAPVLALVALWRFSSVEGWWREPRQWARLALLTAPYVVIGGGALIALGACRCTSAASVYAGGDHVLSNLWLYLGRLVYPIGMEFPGQIGSAHLAAGLTAATIATALLVLGPPLARICVVFLLLALIPFLPIDLWAAARYTYLAAVPFSILAAIVFAEAARFGGRLTPALPALLALAAAGVVALNGWQTWEQNEEMKARSADWEALATGLQETYPELPAGSTVYVRGGPLTDVLLQCAVLPAVGEVLWGEAKLFTFLEGDFETYRIRPGYEVFVADAMPGGFVPVNVPIAARSELGSDRFTLLPHVAPGITGNLCRPGVPTLP